MIENTAKMIINGRTHDVGAKMMKRTMATASAVKMAARACCRADAARKVSRI